TCALPILAEMMALARAAEKRAGVERVSVAAGFAYADVPRVGMGVLAVADGDAGLAAEVASGLAEEAWARREPFQARPPGPAEAVRQALAAARGPVVLADVGD